MLGLDCQIMNQNLLRRKIFAKSDKATCSYLLAPKISTAEILSFSVLKSFTFSFSLGLLTKTPEIDHLFDNFHKNVRSELMFYLFLLGAQNELLEKRCFPFQLANY